jgi:hypothetical protein
MPTMTRFINRLLLGFVALFVFGAVGAAAYQIIWVIPGKRCETAGRWWDPQSRQCATPIYIPHITGRPVDTAAAAAAAHAALPEAERRSPKSVVDARPDF